MQRIKALIDHWSELAQSQVPDSDKNAIKTQAEAMKLLIESYREVNF